RELYPRRAQLARAIDRERETARLERASRVAALLFEPHLDAGGGEPPQAQQRPSLAEVDPRLAVAHRQHLAVAPQRPRAIAETLAQEATALAIERVAHQ